MVMSWFRAPFWQWTYPKSLRISHQQRVESLPEGSALKVTPRPCLIFGFRRYPMDQSTDCRTIHIARRVVTNDSTGRSNHEIPMSKSQHRPEEQNNQRNDGTYLLWCSQNKGSTKTSFDSVWYPNNVLVFMGKTAVQLLHNVWQPTPRPTLPIFPS